MHFWDIKGFAKTFAALLDEVKIIFILFKFIDKLLIKVCEYKLGLNTLKLSR